MDDTATCFEYYGGLATKINGEVLPVPADAVAFAMREPMGVAGQIIPWNYPLMMAAWKIAPALAAGCTVVLKPAEQTPLTILELAKDFEAVGLPPGVVNIVTGDGPGAGAPLVAHPQGPEDRLHRQRRGGQDHHAQRRRPAQAGVARAGRQVAQHLLQRCRLRERGGRRALRHLHQSGRGLLRRQPGAGAAGHLQEVRGCRCGEGEDHQARPRHGPGEQDGAAGERGAARPGGRLPQGRPRRGEGGRGRREAQAVRQGLVHRADDLLRRGQLEPGSPRRRSSARS